MIFFGILFVILGAIFLLFESVGLGKIPGDVVIKTGNVKIYIPLATAALISILGTLFLNLLLFLWRKF